MPDSARPPPGRPGEVPAAEDRAVPPKLPELERERWMLLRQLETLLDGPMIALGFVWLGLLIVDLTAGLGPALQFVGDAIWGLFVLDFALGLLISPRRSVYLRQNWLTAVSLLLPALRVLRIFRAFRALRAARAVRSLSLVRLVTSINRGVGAARSTLGRRGAGYVAAITAIVTFAGAAGMSFLESPAALREAGLAPGGEGVGLGSYGEALWWTAMLMTTLGSEYWPKTGEGRVLAFLLALYAFAVFGYITAAIASYFVGKDRTVGVEQPPAGVTAELALLRREVARLRAELSAAVLRDNPHRDGHDPGHDP